MAIKNALLIADVAHARTRPKRNTFHYGVYYLCLPIRDLHTLGKIGGFTVNKPNLFSFYERDHGACDDSSLEEWIRDILDEWKITQADGDITLVAMPRLFGYAFNPVSFWFCLDKQGQLRAVLSEVNNTFGERHCYLCFHDDQRVIAEGDVLLCEKVFYVSPFIKIRGYYQFRFAYRDQKIAAWIDYYDEDGLMLTTSLTGKCIALTTRNLLRCFFRYPLVTLKVIGLIHYQAFHLWYKGMRYLNHAGTTPPLKEVSR